MLLTGDTNDFGTAVIDGLTSHICVVDLVGAIIAVNRAWRNFAYENSPSSYSSFCGVNYFDVCDHAGGAEAEEAAAFATGLRAVLRGETDLFELEYACHSPTNFQWFLARVTPFMHGRGGAIISHINITERKLLEQKLWTLANIDSLTGLPNRRLFYEKLKSRIELVVGRPHPFAVGLIDLDRFKEINDSFGHDAGDNFLKTVAERLRNVVRESDVLARIGGDEFGLILNDVRTEHDLQARMEPLFVGLGYVAEVDGAPRKIGLSVGVTLSRPGQDEAAHLLKNADLAMYDAKKRGGNRFEVFSPALRETMNRTAQLRIEIEHALEYDEFTLHYQPIVSTCGNRLVGLEALLRWNHPEKGILGAEAFCQAFNDKSLSSSIGSAVINLALAQVQKWNSQGYFFGRVAINVTMWDFIQKDLPTHLKRRLSFYGILPEQICIEVTERLFLDADEDTVATALADLHEMGCEIALDDFGTGFASLSHVKKFPVDSLKIDRSFVGNLVKGIDDLAIVGSIIQLGRSLGISVTAEGVETEGQLEVLRALGCNCVQGYLIARPMSADQVGTFLRGPACRPLRYSAN